ncbi:class I SAM-dependent methyltransferase [Microbacterium maritypicum]|uniref:class I SAM-dependent methyltransferase n=1 Tax=Microbacterium maritypicum TaxID=33918 RepID=UPI001143171D|nr:class I SAM-dependent methyltransferase [Microbacterium liquefaciens]
MVDDSGSDRRIRDGYAARAAEYTQLFGDIGQMDEVDRERIGGWADAVDGRILDAGCGPGHWTAFLAERGIDAEGIDLVPEFVAGACARFPRVAYRVASLTDVGVASGSLGGVLAWYSLIHAGPDELAVLLAHARRVLRDGGALLVGFFAGVDEEPFPHAVTTAHYWSGEGLSVLLERAGFRVVDSDARVQDGRRPHASISAVAV